MRYRRRQPLLRSRKFDDLCWISRRPVSRPRRAGGTNVATVAAAPRPVEKLAEVGLQLPLKPQRGSMLGPASGDGDSDFRRLREGGEGQGALSPDPRASMSCCSQPHSCAAKAAHPLSRLMERWAPHFARNPRRTGTDRKLTWTLIAQGIFDPHDAPRTDTRPRDFISQRQACSSCRICSSGRRVRYCP